MKTRVASCCLRGDAATWWPAYKTRSTMWDSFKNLLRERFNNEELLTFFWAQLYGEEQQQLEEVQSFIQYRRQIVLRLNPTATEKSIIQNLLQIVNPLSRTTLAQRLLGGSPPAGKWLRKEGGGNLPRERAHASQLGVSSAYNLGETNTSLLITINGHATSAFKDFRATDNFVHSRILSAEISI
jgi:hypothetical protein